MSAALVIAELTDRALLRVTGADARPFLHNLLTQDVEDLAPGELRYGALLTPQGRMLHEVFLLGEEDGVLLDAAAAQRDALLARLKMYRLRAKLTIEPLDTAVIAAWSGTSGSHADAGPGWRTDPRLPELGWRRYGEAPTEAQDGDYDAHRLALGIADPLRDMPEDRTYPIEVNLDLLNGIDFRKGCFVGQETTSRMKRRGPIKTRLVPVVFDGPPPPSGAEVLNRELRAGDIRSAREGRALALMRLDRAEGGSLTVEGRAVRLDWPDWLAAALQPADRVHISTRQSA